jgi:spoIIIJ-associated protein
MEKIKKLVKKVLKQMSFEDAEVDIKKDNSLKDKELLVINIEMEAKQAGYFIKENGLGLNALQHLLRVLIYKENPEQTFFTLDINNYRKEREEFLTDLALETAQKARKTKKPVVLEPMSAYERRFIHLKLAEQSDIVTESIGEEPERKVIVRLYP